MSCSLSSENPAAAPTTSTGLARILSSPLQHHRTTTTTTDLLIRHYRASSPPTTYRRFDHLSLPIHSFVFNPESLINRLPDPVPSPPRRRSAESGENSGELALAAEVSGKLSGGIDLAGITSGELSGGQSPAAGRNSGTDAVSEQINNDSSVALFQRHHTTTNSLWSQILALRQSSIISPGGLSRVSGQPVDDPEAADQEGNRFNLGVFFNICALLLATAGTTIVAEFASSKHNPKPHGSFLATVPVFQALNGYNILSVFILMAVVCKNGLGSHKFSRALVFLLFIAGLAEVGAIWVLIMMGCGLETGPAPYIGAGMFLLLFVLLVFFLGPPYSTITTNGDDII